MHLLGPLPRPLDSSGVVAVLFLVKAALAYAAFGGVLPAVATA
jgi:hypothetical protein